MIDFSHELKIRLVKPLLLTLFCLLLLNCSGGFGGDSENASEFDNPLFHNDTTGNLK